MSKPRFAACSGWLAKRRCVRFKAIWRLLRVWARGEGGGGRLARLMTACNAR